MKRRIIVIVGILLLAVAADQATKLWAKDALKGKPAIVVLPGYFDLEYHENPGSVFGLFRNVPGARYLLIVVGVVALVVVFRMIQKVQHRKLAADIAFALVAGGAIGNVWDRIYMARVVDFLVMHIHRKYVWPAYNVADVALVVGVGLLVLVLGRKPEPEAAPAGKRRGKRRK